MLVCRALIDILLIREFNQIFNVPSLLLFSFLWHTYPSHFQSFRSVLPPRPLCTELQEMPLIVAERGIRFIESMLQCLRQEKVLSTLLPVFTALTLVFKALCSSMEVWGLSRAR